MNRIGIPLLFLYLVVGVIVLFATHSLKQPVLPLVPAPSSSLRDPLPIGGLFLRSG